MISELLLSDTVKLPPELSHVPVRILTESQFRTTVASVTPQGVAAVVRIPDGYYASTLPPKPGKCIVYLDNVQDPGNVGSILRTAAAFGFDGVVLSEGSADPFSPKVAQATAGTLFVPWLRRSSSSVAMLAALKNAGFTICCADVNGRAGLEFDTFGRIVLVLGNEGNGISEEVMSLADVRYSIPMEHQNAESLNVAVSGAISMFTVYRRNLVQ